MSSTRQYLVCSQRAGSPRVALEVCGICRKAKRCPDLRDFNCPGLFPGLEPHPPRTGRRAAVLGAAKASPALAQAALPLGQQADPRL